MRQSDAPPSITTPAASQKMRGPIASLMLGGAKALGAAALACAATPATAAEQTPTIIPTYAYMQGVSPACHEKPAGESLTPAGELLRAWLAANLHTDTNDCLLNRLSQMSEIQSKLQQLYGASSPFLAYDLTHHGDHLLEILSSNELIDIALQIHQHLPTLPFSAQEIFLLQVALLDADTTMTLLDTIREAPEIKITTENAKNITASLAHYVYKYIGLRDFKDPTPEKRFVEEVTATKKSHAAALQRKKELGLIYTQPKPGDRPEVLFWRAEKYAASIETHKAEQLAILLTAEGYTMNDVIGDILDVRFFLERIMDKLDGLPFDEVIQRFKTIHKYSKLPLCEIAGILSNQEIFQAIVIDLDTFLKKTAHAADDDIPMQALIDYALANIAINTRQTSTVEHYVDLVHNFRLFQTRDEMLAEHVAPSATNELPFFTQERPEYQGSRLKLLQHPNADYIKKEYPHTDYSTILFEFSDDQIDGILGFLDAVAKVNTSLKINIMEMRMYVFDSFGSSKTTPNPQYLKDLANIIGSGGNLRPHLWRDIAAGRHFGDVEHTEFAHFKKIMSQEESKPIDPNSPEGRRQTLTNKDRSEKSFTSKERTNYMRLIALLDLANFESIEPLMLLAVNPDSKALFTDTFLGSLQTFQKKSGEQRIRFSDIGFHLFLYKNPALRDIYLTIGRDGLETRIKTQQVTRRHLSRVTPESAAYKLVEQDLSTMSLVDLIRIDLISKGLEQAKIKNDLLDGMQKDFADTTREHGGLLEVDNHNNITLQYDPGLDGSDDSFRMTPEMQVKLALNHGCFFHFHAVGDMGDRPKRTSNLAYYAGPSGMTSYYGDLKPGGDMNVSKSSNIAEIVFTPLDADRFNADVFLPNNTVIDLGIYASGTQEIPKY